MNSYGNENTTMLNRDFSEIDFNRIQKQLGSGSFGTVWMIDEGDGKKYALKKIIKLQIHRRLRQEQQRREIEIMSKIDNPHVISFIDASEDSSYIYIKMEYVEGQNLRQFLLTNRDMSTKERRKLGVRLFLQFLNAIGSLRVYRIMNRDIKPDNIMVTKYQNLDEVIIKMIDLGESKYANSCENTIQAGTDYYMAPEVYKSKQYNDLCDIWSLAVMVFQVFQGTLDLPSDSKKLNLPYRENRQDNNPQQYIKKDVYENLILSVNLIPTPIRYLLRRMLNPDNKERIKFVKILEYLLQHIDQLKDELGNNLEEERKKLADLLAKEKLIALYSEEEKKVGRKIQLLHEEVYLPIKKELDGFNKKANLDIIVMMHQICLRLADLQEEMYEPFQEIYEKDEYKDLWIQEYLNQSESKQIKDDTFKLKNQIERKKQQKIDSPINFHITKPIRQFLRQYFSIKHQKMLRIIEEIVIKNQ